MASLKSKIDLVMELAEDAQAKSSYNNWESCAKVLLKKGYAPHEAATILRSKITRWAADMLDGKGTDQGIIAYLEKYPLSQKELDEMKIETFGE